MNLERFFEAFVCWAKAQPDIEGVAIVGSYARGTQREDSDVDLMILTSEQSRYTENQDWMSLFGEVVRARNESWGCVETVRAVYEAGDIHSPGFEIEFGFAPLSWADVPIDAGTRRVASDGMEILFDPRGKLGSLLKALATNPC